MSAAPSFPTDETRCGRSHNMSETTGYVAVRTAFGRGRIADAEVFEESEYGQAISLVHKLREEAPEGEYARCDILYADGCRGIL